MSDVERCKERVFDPGFRGFSHHQCHRKVVKDGYCTIHHPDAVAARHAKAMIRHNEAYKRSPLGRAIEEMKLVEELKVKVAELLKEREELVSKIAEYVAVIEALKSTKLEDKKVESEEEGATPEMN